MTAGGTLLSEAATARSTLEMVGPSTSIDASGSQIGGMKLEMPEKCIDKPSTCSFWVAVKDGMVLSADELPSQDLGRYCGHNGH